MESSPWLERLNMISGQSLRARCVALLTDMASAAPRDTSRQIDAFFRAAVDEFHDTELRHGTGTKRLK